MSVWSKRYNVHGDKLPGLSGREMLSLHAGEHGFIYAVRDGAGAPVAMLCRPSNETVYGLGYAARGMYQELTEHLDPSDVPTFEEWIVGEWTDACESLFDMERCIGK